MNSLLQAVKRLRMVPGVQVTKEDIAATLDAGQAVARNVVIRDSVVPVNILEAESRDGKTCELVA